MSDDPPASNKIDSDIHADKSKLSIKSTQQISIVATPYQRDETFHHCVLRLL